jgi:hypothetical protein
MKSKQQAIEELNISIEYAPLEGKKDKYEIVTFNSSYELITKMQTCSEDFGMYNSNEHKAKPGGDIDSWAYGQLKNYDTTLEYLSEGKVLDSVLEIATKIYDTLTMQPEIVELFSKAETFKRKRVYQEDGAELCIDRVMAGDPAHWQRMTRGKKMPLIKLGLNLAGSRGEEEEHFNKLSAVCGVVVDILSRSGYSVELYSCVSGSNITSASNKTTVMTRIKAAEEEIDMSRIYSIGCSGFLRCWMFKVYYYILKGDPQYGLGQPISVTEEMKTNLGLDFIIDSSFTGNNQAAFTKITGLFQQVIENK